MKIELKKKPKGCTLIEGFPGFGLVGTIATEFLIDQLDCEQIGRVMIEGMPPLVAIHEGSLVEPLGIFHNKKHNLIILHAITASTGFEWKLATALVKLAKELAVKEILSLEGVGSPGMKVTSSAFYYTNQEKNRKLLEHYGMKPLKEGIIMGVTGALLLQSEKLPVTSFFADTASNMPDSKAAARVVEGLTKYLGIRTDLKPLEKQAELFEKKLSGILNQSKKAQDLSERKKMSYVG